MDTQIDYSPEENLIRQSLQGACSIANLSRVMESMQKYPISPGLRILTDITNADLEDTDYSSLYQLESRLDILLDKYMPIYKAIVVNSDLEFGIARMYQMLAEKEGFEVRVFRDTTKAEAWLASCMAWAVCGRHTRMKRAGRHMSTEHLANASLFYLKNWVNL